MPRISVQRAEDRRNSILDAARQVFTTKGFAKTSINDIAEIAGISDGLIYRYFGGKRDLLLRVLQEFYEELIVETEAAVNRETSFDRRFEVLVFSHLSVFMKDMDLCRLFITEIRSLDDYVGSEIQSLNRRYTSIFIRMMASGIEQGIISETVDLRLIRDLLFGGMEHLAWRSFASGTLFSVDEAGSQITRILLFGLKGVNQ